MGSTWIPHIEMELTIQVDLEGTWAGRGPYGDRSTKKTMGGNFKRSSKNMGDLRKIGENWRFHIWPIKKLDLRQTAFNAGGWSIPYEPAETVKQLAGRSTTIVATCQVLACTAWKHQKLQSNGYQWIVFANKHGRNFELLVLGCCRFIVSESFLERAKNSSVTTHPGLPHTEQHPANCPFNHLLDSESTSIFFLIELQPWHVIWSLPNVENLLLPSLKQVLNCMSVEKKQQLKLEIPCLLQGDHAIFDLVICATLDQSIPPCMAQIFIAKQTTRFVNSRH